MPTRRSDEPEQRNAQERFMSNREYVARRGILGNAVAAKAQLYRSAAYRSLLFFLQGLSMKDGGLKAVANDLFDMFPDRVEKGQSRLELPPDGWSSIFGHQRIAFTNRRAVKIDWFAEFLQRLCIDPAIDVEEISEKKSSSDATYFRDPVGALIEYRKINSADELSRNVVTAIGSKVHRWLDRALSARRMVVIEGSSGAGKSHAAKLWCRLHLGEARFVELSGITHRTGLFQKIGAALGLAICQHASSKLQAKVESHLDNTKLMLVIDEAHFLWPQHKRTTSPPELINWIDTLVNMGVPIALICTDQFAKLKSHVERQTEWTADQFIHRTWLKETIDERPTKEDLLSVTRSLLSFRWSDEHDQWLFDAHSRPDRAHINSVALYAKTNVLPLPSIRNTIDEAQVCARERGGNMVNAADIDQALESRQRSDVAIRAAFDSRSKASPRVKRGAAAAAGREQTANFSRLVDEESATRFRSTGLPVRL